MDPYWKKKWAEALRSGEYKQTVSTLRDRDSYCCLGVLCDLAAKEGVGKWENDGFNDDEDYSDIGLIRSVALVSGVPTDKDMWNELPLSSMLKEDETVEDLLSAYNMRWVGERMPRYITDLNDKTRIGFEGIAQLIEERL